MKKLILPIILLVGLSITAYMYLSRPAKTTQSVQISELITDASDVNKIVLSDGQNGEIHLSKKKGEWVITAPFEYKASQASVKKMLEAIAEVQLANVISENPEKFTKFQVADEGMKVSLFKDEELLRAFFPGKNSRDYSQSYYRLDGTQDVLIGTAVPGYLFNPDPNKWRDRNILGFDETSIDSIQLQSGKNLFLFTPDSTNWMVFKNAKPFDIESKKQSALIQKLKKFTCVGFADSVDMSQKENEVTLRIFDKSGLSEFELFQIHDESYIKRGKNSPIFKIAESDYKRFVLE